MTTQNKSTSAPRGAGELEKALNRLDHVLTWLTIDDTVRGFITEASNNIEKAATENARLREQVAELLSACKAMLTVTQVVTGNETRDLDAHNCGWIAQAKMLRAAIAKAERGAQ